jgi:hypothetical protein
MPPLTPDQKLRKKLKEKLTLDLDSTDPKISSTAAKALADMYKTDTLVEERMRRERRIAKRRERAALENAPEPEPGPEPDPFEETPEESAARHRREALSKPDPMSPEGQRLTLMNKLAAAARRHDTVQVTLIRQKLGLPVAPLAPPVVTVPLPAYPKPEGTQEVTGAPGIDAEAAQAAEEARIRRILAQNPISDEEIRTRALQAKRWPAAKGVRTFGESDLPYHDLSKPWPYRD